MSVLHTNCTHIFLSHLQTDQCSQQFLSFLSTGGSWAVHSTHKWVEGSTLWQVQKLTLINWDECYLRYSYLHLVPGRCNINLKSKLEFGKSICFSNAIKNTSISLVRALLVLDLKNAACLDVLTDGYCTGQGFISENVTSQRRSALTAVKDDPSHPVLTYVHWNSHSLCRGEIRLSNRMVPRD